MYVCGEVFFRVDIRFLSIEMFSICGWESGWGAFGAALWSVENIFLMVEFRLRAKSFSDWVVAAFT